MALKRELKQAAQAADEEQVRPDVAVAFGGEKRAFHSWAPDFGWRFASGNPRAGGFSFKSVLLAFGPITW